MKKKLILMIALLCCLVLAVGILAACNGDQGTQTGGQTPGGTDNPGDIDQPGDTDDPGDIDKPGDTDEPGGDEPVGDDYTEGLVFKLASDGESYSVTDYTGTSTEVVIPSVYEGLPVTRIGSFAFGAYLSSKNVTNIIIPDSITSISSNAFTNSRLKSIKLPSGLKSISEQLFYNCKELTSVVIPDGVESIGRRAFMYCSKLGSVTIPNSVTIIEMEAFCECIGLTSVAIGNGVKEMEDCAFSDCTSLTSITIPKSVTQLEGAFSRCSALSSIAVEEGNPVYHSAGNCLINTENKDLILGCKNSIIPDDGSVTGIAERAFENCIGLTTVIIPEGVTSIGKNAFHGCSGLTSVTIPKSMTHMTNGVFADCSSLTTVKFEGTVAEWKAVYKGIMGTGNPILVDWNENSPFTEVVCSDGNVSV